MPDARAADTALTWSSPTRLCIPLVTQLSSLGVGITLLAGSSWCESGFVRRNCCAGVPGEDGKVRAGRGKASMLSHHRGKSFRVMGCPELEGTHKSFIKSMSWLCTDHPKPLTTCLTALAMTTSLGTLFQRLTTLWVSFIKAFLPSFILMKQ